MLHAVPVSPQIQGYVNVMSLETVTSGIIDGLCRTKSSTKSQLEYVNLIGNVDVPFSELKECIERETGIVAQSLPPAD
ncbi:hypothetical protein BJY01DRAFT_211227 [Aspergillus pseudoustus]|uniref:Uncharacterized protein n=1 Tax=Aspergillus pseudoustus TaxID=1810923 RepID=A0ABR4K9D1_9EURO